MGSNRLKISQYYVTKRFDPNINHYEGVEIGCIKILKNLLVKKFHVSLELGKWRLSGIESLFRVVPAVLLLWY